MTDDSPHLGRFPSCINPLEGPLHIHPYAGIDFDFYLRSACNDFVTLLKELKCKQCDLPFSSNDEEYPVIACCGHYVHSRCMYDNEEKEKGRKKIPFMCRDCLGKVNNDRRSIKGCIIPVVPFKAFFAAIEEPGYKCIGCVFGRHPENNVVRMVDTDTSKLPKYLCVWCCALKDDFKDTPVRHLKPEDSVHIKKSSTGLRSLDRKFDIFGGIPNLQCCTCSLPVIDLSPKHDRRVHIEPVAGDVDILPCGHIRHKSCKRENEVYCNLCRSSTKVNVQTTVSHIQDYITRGNLDEKDLLFTAYPCDQCNPGHYTFHPKYNTTGEVYKYQGHTVYDTLCVWCAVDNSMDKRTERRGREQKKGQAPRSKSVTQRISKFLNMRWNNKGDGTRRKKKGDGTEGLLQYNDQTGVTD